MAKENEMRELAASASNLWSQLKQKANTLVCVWVGVGVSASFVDRQHLRDFAALPHRNTSHARRLPQLNTSRLLVATLHFYPLLLLAGGKDGYSHRP